MGKGKLIEADSIVGCGATDKSANFRYGFGRVHQSSLTGASTDIQRPEDCDYSELVNCGVSPVVEGLSNGSRLKMESDAAALGMSETVDTEFSRSNSPKDSSNDSVSRNHARQESKICGVCGDKALGNNFNAVTCESCKAFFRRNALKTKEFVCPFNDNCKVDAVTRRFCQKCRLKKCFDVGMKKEWIMTNEEKQIKKIKIQQNRLKRRSGDTPVFETPVTKAACVIPQDSPPDPTLPHKVCQEAILPGEEHESESRDSDLCPSAFMSTSNAVQIANNPWIKLSHEEKESCKLDTPLLTSLIRPGLVESSSDKRDEPDCSGSDFVGSTDSPNLDEARDVRCSSAAMTSADTVPLLDAIQNTNIESASYAHCESWSTGLPLPLNTMDSIVSVAIKAEFSSVGAVICRGVSSSQSRLLNKAEQNKLDELLLASQALNAPVDAEGLVKVSDQSLINVINLTDIAIRRLIKMSKKISAFKNMCQEDQIALLKGGCTEMMILRSVVSYDPDRDSWKIPHSKRGYNINLGVLKEARGNLYEEHQRFLKSFRPEWRADENIMMLLCSVTLFTPERPNVIHRDVVKLEQDSYYYLLKRYLESILDGCEARSAYLKLIKIIAELRVLNSNHLKVFLALNPREVAPLLIEIFDLK